MCRCSLDGEVFSVAHVSIASFHAVAQVRKSSCVCETDQRHSKVVLYSVHLGEPGIHIHSPRLKNRGCTDTVPGSKAGDA